MPEPKFKIGEVVELTRTVMIDAARAVRNCSASSHGRRRAALSDQEPRREPRTRRQGDRPQALRLRASVLHSSGLR